MKKAALLIVLSLFAGSFSGCATLGYLFQAGKGQLALINRAKPISDVLKDERTPPRIKRLLSQIEPVKRFGERFGLKPTRNYTEYVKLDRPAAVWVVSAAEKLKFKSKEWHFPVIGSVPYLGWFDLPRAKEFAKKLEQEGWDVDLRGAGAYSTLGWFTDPVLSSMISEGEEALGDLVNVVLHESVHATFYLQGEAYFNESLASFVADKLTDTYLAESLGPQAPEKTLYDQAERDSEVRQKRLQKAYDDLKTVYESQQSDAEKTAAKERILAELKTELHFRRPINNATLIQYKAYNTGFADFEALYTDCGSDWRAFWGAIRKLNEQSFSEKQQADLSKVLQPLRNQCHPRPLQESR